MEKMVEELVNEWFALLCDKLGMPDVSKHFKGEVQDKSSKHAPRTNFEKERPEPFLEDVEEETPCMLFLPELEVESHGLLVVAFGHVQPTVNGKVSHLRGVDEGDCCVSVDSVVDGWEDTTLPLPREDWGVMTIGDARGSFVTWPCKWVCLANQGADAQFGQHELIIEELNGKHVPSISRDNNNGGRANKEVQKKISSKGSNLGADTFDVGEDLIRSLSFPCQWLHGVVKDEPDNVVFRVVLSKLQFRYFEDTETWITKKDVNDFLIGEQLSVALLQAFMSLLHLDLDGCETILKVGWLCPQEIYDQRCLKNKEKVKDYIETSIKEAMQSKRKLLFPTYLQDAYWVLLMISPSTYTVYVLDSCRTEPSRSLMIMTWVNSVMKKIRTSTMIPKSVSVKYAQQQNVVECGYYVMRYMYNIVASCTEMDDLQMILSTSTTIREGPFTVSEIDEVRDKLAKFLTTYCS